MNAGAIRDQQAEGFFSLRFAPALETRYRQVRAAGIRRRARLVAMAGLLLFVIYAGLDLVTLPNELARLTVTLRLTVTCPMIGLVLWLAHRSRPSDQMFERLYTLTYMVGGLTVITIILLARSHNVPLPYEGMILMLMFGYFAMGLPFLAASLVSTFLVLTYVLAELWSGTAAAITLSNLFFLATANVIGMVGAWITEYRHRAHYLDRQLLDQLHQAARDESQRKTELFTAASHDLRQPLDVLELTLRNLASAGSGTGQNNLQGALPPLRDSVNQLRRLLTTVFDSARLNEGLITPRVETLWVANLFDDIQDLTESTLTCRHFELEMRIAADASQLTADPSLLLRVLQNLVINAIEHSQGNRVWLCAERVGHQVRLTVQDNGRGMAPDVAERLFQPYVRGAGAGNIPGLGLGLTIVRNFTELMGGQCGLHREAVIGTAVWITLPAATTTSPAPAPD